MAQNTEVGNTQAGKSLDVIEKEQCQREIMLRFKVESDDTGKIRCDACPVLCYIKDGRSGACDRYANEGGELVRLDPLTILEHIDDPSAKAVRFLESVPSSDDGAEQDESENRDVAVWDGDLLQSKKSFVTAIGAGTTYPDYKPAPFIVGQKYQDVDMVTVVTEGIFSYCGVKVKIDTDRHLGPERATVRADGEAIGHVTTGEYGSQMLSLGGVNHLTGGSKKEGRLTCQSLLQLCNKEAVELTIDGGAELVVQAGQAPIVDGVQERLMRVGCGSATIGMFARQWQPFVDEVVVVDDHITGVLSEHQAGKLLGMPATGIRINGRRSTPGRYFQVAEPGSGWGGTDVTDPLSIIDEFRAPHAYPGLRMLMVSTTGEQSAYYVLDDALRPQPADLPDDLKPSVQRIAENCEPSLCTVLFMGGAGGSLRAGVTENPVKLTRAVRDALTHVSCAGVPAYVWPGGGITLMVDVLNMPKNAFGYVPTPALVAPIEFTLRLEDYEKLGGHMAQVQPLEAVIPKADRHESVNSGHAWPGQRRHFAWG